MNVLFKKVIGFLKLLRRCSAGIQQDGAVFGYRNALAWHSTPLWNQICYYANLMPRTNPIRVQLCRNPIWLRPGTSDYDVYQQVFRDEEYGDVETDTEIKYILDCGANIGLASIYFLNRFPDSRVLAVEPDPENASICRRNLHPYGTRATVLEGGVWGSCGRLKVVASEFGPGQKSGMGVRPLRNGDSDNAVVDAFDIPSLMAAGGFEEIDLLKIDIECSERNVFSSSADRWLPRVHNLVIELHDEACRRVFFSAMKEYNFRASSRGDLTYCLDLKVAGASK